MLWVCVRIQQHEPKPDHREKIQGKYDSAHMDIVGENLDQTMQNSSRHKDPRQREDKQITWPAKDE